MPLTSLILVAEATVYKHTKGKTLYVSIPSKMALDSQFTIKDGDHVDILFDKETGEIRIKPKAATAKKR